MRALKHGTYTLTGLTSMGGPAKLTIGKGERITEAQWKALSDTDKARFTRIGTPKAASKSKSDSKTDDTTNG